MIWFRNSFHGYWCLFRYMSTDAENVGGNLIFKGFKTLDPLNSSEELRDIAKNLDFGELNSVCSVTCVFCYKEGTPAHSYILPGESHGQRSLAGWGPWGCKESDTTEATEHASPAMMLSQGLLSWVSVLDDFYKMKAKAIIMKTGETDALNKW